MQSTEDSPAPKRQRDIVKDLFWFLTDNQELAQKRQRYIIKSLFRFWPIVEEARDVTRVGRLGYWFCFYYGLFNIFAVADLISKISEEVPSQKTIAVLFLISLISFLFLAGNAVRESSRSASILLFVVVLCEAIAVFVFAGFEYHSETYAACTVLSSLIIMRGAFLAHKWKLANEKDSLLYGTLLIYRLSDRWPRKIWPRFQILFWISGAFVLYFLGFFIYEGFLSA